MRTKEGTETATHSMREVGGENWRRGTRGRCELGCVKGSANRPVGLTSCCMSPSYMSPSSSDAIGGASSCEIESGRV